MSLFKKWVQKYKNFKKDKKGATAIEYALLAALLSVAIIGGLKAVGATLSSTYATVNTALASANKASTG
jgi:pilus assembly protein Flp/PilA